MNGNMNKVIATDSTHREMVWDKENRMLSLNDDGYVSRYTYDHTGTRTVKSHGPMEAVYVNGAPQRDPIYLNWLNPDPLTEKYPMCSAYSYCYGNPVGFVDLDGMETVIYIFDQADRQKDNGTRGNTGDDSGKIYIYRGDSEESVNAREKLKLNDE